MRCKVSHINVLFYLSLIYILMRPVINEYVTEYTKIVLIVFLCYYSLKTLISKNKLKKIGSIELIFYFLVWVYVFISALANGGFELLLYTVERYMFYSLPLFLIPSLQGHINWKGVFAFLSAFGVLDACISIIEFVTKKQLVVIGVEQLVQQQWGDNSLRTYGLSGNYFLLAEILCFCGLAALHMAFQTRKKIFALAFGIISIGIFTTGSRGYMVAFFVGVCVMYMLNSKVRGKTLSVVFRWILILMFVFLALFLIFFTDIETGWNFLDTILNRIRSIVDFSGNKANIKRVEIWLQSLEYWNEKPLFGWGAQCTDTRYSKFVSVTESGILKRLVELGLIGTILQYCSLFYPIKKGLKKFNRTPSEYRDFIFPISMISCLLVEDIVLQQYTSMEYTIIIWSCLSYILTVKHTNCIEVSKNKAKSNKLSMIDRGIKPKEC